MNKKEISELRRRLNPDKNNLTVIRGCYVDEKRQIVSEFYQPVLSIPQEELEKYMGIFRRALSGIPGKTLVDVVFRPDQVMDGAEHKLLMTLRETALKDEASVGAFYEKVIDNFSLEGNYLILLAHDAFDLPGKFGDDSEEVFQYILCAICPVRQSKPALSYYAVENEFHNRVPDWVVASPEAGFLFPAFDDRATNIYNALYYTHDSAQPHEELTGAIFGAEMPMPAAVQKEAFESVLEDALCEDLNYEVVRAVHEELRERIEEKKADKEAEAPTISKREVQSLLRAQGMPEERVQAFEDKYDETFGRGVDLNAQSVVDVKRLELTTPDVTIRVAPDRADLVETRVIDGTKYILIRADENVEVNGVGIRI